MFGCGVWVCILFCLLGFGSAMEGPGLSCRILMAPTPTLEVRHSGCYTSAVVLPFPTRMPWETCRCRGRLCAGTSVPRFSARPLYGTAFDSKPSRGNRIPPLITTAESRMGSEALIPVMPGRKLSPASQCGRLRRPKTGGTDSAETPEGGRAA